MQNFLFILLIIPLATLGIIGTDIYLPSLPFMAEDFGTSDRFVQLTLSAYFFSYSFIPLFMGPLSDMLGRRKILLFGLFGAFLSSLFCFFAPDIIFFIAARIFQGVAFGTVSAMAGPLIFDHFKGNEQERVKFSGNIASLTPILLALVPLAGGAIQDYFNWRGIFAALTFYAALIYIFCYFKIKCQTVKASIKNNAHFSFKKAYFDILSNKGFMLYALIPAYTMIGIVSYFTVTTYYFQQEYNLSPMQYGSMAIVISVTVILSGYLNRLLKKIFMQKQIIFIGAMIFGAASFLFLVAYYYNFLSLVFIQAMAALYFLGFKLCTANAFTLAFRFVKQNLGTATAMIVSLKMMISLLVTMLMSIFDASSILIGAICFGVSSLLCLFNLSLDAHYKIFENRKSLTISLKQRYYIFINKEKSLFQGTKLS